MPRELPGFYFDEEKKRYFPLSSKPAGTPRSSNPSRSSSHQHASDSQLGRTAQPLASVSSITVSHGLKRKRANVCWDESESLRRSAPGSLQSRRCMHEIICANIVSTSLATKVPVPDPTHSSITAFRTANIDGRVRMFYGDTNGWLYSFNDYNVDDTSIQTPQSDHRPMGCWVPELSLTSEISSICISDSRCIATSFGPACRILVQDLSSADTFILNPGSSYMHDIWTSHLRGRNLALGSNKKAIFVKDIDAARSLDILDTQSDVYAVEQQENLVYTGARNGSISRFDMRLDDLRGQNLLDDAFKTQGNSVTNLNIIREWQLVVGSINGSLAAYDLRFSRRSTPLMTFSGHKNSYTNRSAVAIDPSENFLFAAGQDGRIRAWSLQSGQALLPPPSSLAYPMASSLRSNPFSDQFSQHVATMQVTEERDGMYLWAASDKNLFKYHLGQQRC